MVFESKQSAVFLLTVVIIEDLKPFFCNCIISTLVSFSRMVCFIFLFGEYNDFPILKQHQI